MTYNGDFTPNLAIIRLIWYWEFLGSNRLGEKKIPFSNHFPIFENLLELVVS